METAHLSAPAPTSAIATEPAVTLLPATREAQTALGDRVDVRITRFPYRIGRESRSAPRSASGSSQVNDIYLVESSTSHLVQISREHCSIERRNGQFFLIDRGSACGTGVISSTAGESTARRVGGDRRGGTTELQDGDLI